MLRSILFDQFRASRTGDLLVVANEGYDFRQRYEVPEHKSGHGSMFRAHMQTSGVVQPTGTGHSAPDGGSLPGHAGVARCAGA